MKLFQIKLSNKEGIRYGEVKDLIFINQTVGGTSWGSNQAKLMKLLLQSATLV